MSKRSDKSRLKRPGQAVFSMFLVLAAIVANFPLGRAQTQSPPPYKNPSLPIEARVDDLVSRMTLEEKVSQMMNASPAIERLGIPQYDWWNEALHGVARAGCKGIHSRAIARPAVRRPRPAPCRVCRDAAPADGH